jgi:peptidoglycan/LPS O-acetylase OafA/YrhL
MIFFVLSGFVLAYSLEKAPLPYRAYLAKRFCRIYPVFLFVLLFSYVAHLLIGVPHDVASEWLAQVNSPDLSITTLIENITLWGTPRSHDLNGVTWSLVHEMRISILFPLLFAFVTRYAWRSLIALSLLSLSCMVVEFSLTGVVGQGHHEDSFAKSFLDTGYFVVFFASGAYLAIRRQSVSSAITRAPKYCLVVLGVIVTYCLLKTDYDRQTLMGGLVDYMRGIGAVGLIALAMGSTHLRDCLSHAVLTWLGRISYSLYLVHLPLLYVVNQTVGSTWAVLPLSIVLIVLSLVSAEILASLVEAPSSAAGKLIANRIARRDITAMNRVGQ